VVGHERIAQRGSRRGQLRFDGGTRRELRLLGEVSDRSAAPELQLPAVGWHGAGEDLHQRGFARAVDADEPDALAFLDHELQIAEDGPAAEGEGERGRAKERHLPGNLDRNVAPGRGSAVLAPGHHEHEAAVRHVPAMELYGLGILQQTRDLGFRVGALVDDGIADPAPAIVSAQHLPLLAPIGRVLAGGLPAAATHGVGEDGANLAIRALPDPRLVAEEEERLSGTRVAQAAAKRLAALRGHLLDGRSRDVDAARADTLEDLGGKRMDLEVHGRKNSGSARRRWLLSDVSSRYFAGVFSSAAGVVAVGAVARGATSAGVLGCSAGVSRSMSSRIALSPFLKL